MWYRKEKEIRKLREERKQTATVALMLLELAEGCTTHPSYRAVRKPKADCKKCAILFYRREALNNYPRAKEIGYIPRTGKRGKSQG